MNSYLLSLTWDVQFLICIQLPIDALASLRKTCKRLSWLISSDKQLWVEVLEREVLNKNINLHPLRTPLELASASHVESWMRCLRHLHFAHQGSAQPHISRIRLELRITWLRIIRTCWCLVASSSEHESRLTIWNTRNGGSICAEYYLSGPVVDGIIEDDGTNIVVALTIGSSNMHIHVLSIAKTGTAAAIFSLRILPDVSSVRGLKGPWIICAVRAGDDTYPTLVNWEKNLYWQLVPRRYIDQADLPWGLLHCPICAATQWFDWIVVIMAKSVEVFRVVDIENPMNPVLSITSLPILGSHSRVSFDNCDIEEAAFQNSTTFEGQNMLSFSCRKKGGRYMMFSIVFDGSEFLIREGYVEEEKFIGGSPNSGSKFVVAPASNYEVHLRVFGGYNRLPNLVFVRIDRCRNNGAPVGAVCPRIVNEGFPLLHFTTSLNFDDGVGLLVLGTSKGYLCFARFLPEEMIAIGSLMDELPNRNTNKEELSVVPVKMDIPSYYNQAQKSKFDPPRQSIEEAIASWPLLAKGSVPSGPWSNDWIRYKGVRQWVLPAERWPINDTGEYHDPSSVVSHIRLAMTTYGDIIPLAYRQDPEVVFYRIGPRYYMVWSLTDEDDEPVFKDGALPNLHSNLPLGSELLETLRQSGVQDNIGKYGNTGECYMYEAAKRITHLISVVSKHADKLETELSIAGSDPNCWTSQDLIMIFNKALFLM